MSVQVQNTRRNLHWLDVGAEHYHPLCPSVHIHSRDVEIPGYHPHISSLTAGAWLAYIIYKSSRSVFYVFEWIIAIHGPEHVKNKWELIMKFIHTGMASMLQVILPFILSQNLKNAGVNVLADIQVNVIGNWELPGKILLVLDLKEHIVSW